jgi:glycerol uptake facilitator-like aquaporin
MQTYLMKLIHTKNLYARIFLAELLATFLLVSCGVGAVAQNKFNVTENPQLASSLSIALAFGFGAGVGIICCGKVSGPAINPAVSFCSFLNGRITLQTMLCAWLGQFAGAFLGAIAVFFAYYDSFHGFRNGMYR